MRSSTRHALFAPLLALGLCLGCSSSPDATMSDQELNIDQAEPAGGTPDAPPFGAARPKLAPDEVIKKQQEDEDKPAAKPEK